MPKIDYKKREITLVGRTKDTEDDKACGVCQDADNFLSSRVKNDSRITYNKIEVDTPEGEKMAAEADVRWLPYIKDCKTYTDGGKPRCKEYEGFEKDDWDDLSEVLVPEKKEEDNKPFSAETPQKVEKAQHQQPEKVEIDTESGIEEPAEPHEPSQ